MTNNRTLRVRRAITVGVAIASAVCLVTLFYGVERAAFLNPCNPSGVFVAIGLGLVLSVPVAWGSRDRWGLATVVVVPMLFVLFFALSVGFGEYCDSKSWIDDGKSSVDISNGVASIRGNTNSALADKVTKALASNSETIHTIRISGNGGFADPMRATRSALVAGAPKATLIVDGPCLSACALIASTWPWHRVLGEGGTLGYHASGGALCVWNTEILSETSSLISGLRARGVAKEAAAYYMASQDIKLLNPIDARACGFVDDCENGGCPAASCRWD